MQSQSPALHTANAPLPGGLEQHHASGHRDVEAVDVTCHGNRHQEVARFVNTPEAKERFLNGATEPVGSSPEAFAASIKSDQTKWGKIIQDAGIRDE